LLTTTPRSGKRVVHSGLGVKSWASALPSCAAARPSCCPTCEAPSRVPGKSLTIVGHGLRGRGIEGPHEPGEEAFDTPILCRRYVCLACGAILVVVPSGVGRGLRYSLSAIAYALALWGYARKSAEQARKATSTARARGRASPEQWSSLRRWVWCASAIYGAAVPRVLGALRERAAALSAWLASHAPVPTSQVPRDAFSGGRFVHARGAMPMRARASPT
jgi:hypothetical protein